MNSLSIHLFFPLVLYSAFQSSFAETNYTAAVLSDFPPLYTTDKSGKPAGFAIDILERLSQKNISVPLSTSN
jgi:hypothetical protein